MSTTRILIQVRVVESIKDSDWERLSNPMNLAPILSTSSLYRLSDKANGRYRSWNERYSLLTYKWMSNLQKAIPYTKKIDR